MTNLEASLAALQGSYQTNGSGPHEDEDRHSWHPIDLLRHASDPPEPPTIAHLVYPGRRHLFSGEPESLKSWAAMVLCVDQIRQGHCAAYIDFEMGARETLARLRALGVTDDELALFVYLEPDEPFNLNSIQADVDELLYDRRPTLIVLDAFTGALQIHQLDPNKSIDIETFDRQVIAPLRRHGAATVILDHLPKDPLSRGRFSIGSERKVGVSEVHLGFEVIVPFGRGRTGRAKIITHKDRPGWLHRPRAAELELQSSPSGEIQWLLEQPADTDGAFRPTFLMERVSRYLEAQAEPIAKSEVEKNVQGNGPTIRQAVDQLVVEGFVARTIGGHNAHRLVSKSAFREANDSSSSSSSTLVLSSSESTQTLRSASSSSSSPPYGGGLERMDELPEGFRKPLVQDHMDELYDNGRWHATLSEEPETDEQPPDFGVPT